MGNRRLGCRYKFVSQMLGIKMETRFVLADAKRSTKGSLNQREAANAALDLVHSLGAQLLRSSTCYQVLRPSGWQLCLWHTRHPQSSD